MIDQSPVVNYNNPKVNSNLPSIFHVDRNNLPINLLHLQTPRREHPLGREVQTPLIEGADLPWVNPHHSYFVFLSPF